MIDFGHKERYFFKKIEFSRIFFTDLFTIFFDKLIF